MYNGHWNFKILQNIWSGAGDIMHIFFKRPVFKSLSQNLEKEIKTAKRIKVFFVCLSIAKFFLSVKLYD